MDGARESRPGERGRGLPDLPVLLWSGPSEGHLLWAGGTAAGLPPEVSEQRPAGGKNWKGLNSLHLHFHYNSDVLLGLPGV